MSDTAQQIKEKLDIVQFLRGYVELAPAGKNFKARCPFHKERSPSFMVSPDRQTWHCFGSCNTGGDIFTFLMKYENLEFFEALKVLAEKAGIELRRADPAEERQFGVLYDLQLKAKEFFVAELARAARAKEYLSSRKLKQETIDEFELGFAPNVPDALTLFLIKKGFNVQDMERSGLILKGERGGYFDRFRGRIMFPIANHFGKTVGFTGRVLPEFDNGQMGKYVNSPETAIFKKSKLLYGFAKTKGAIREANEALLVEGQMDFLKCYEVGVKNVIATSGTALTADHLAVLRRYAERLIFSFDNDEAGGNAAERAIDLANAGDFEVKILQLPEGLKDPAEAAERDPAGFLGLVSQGIPASEFYFSRFVGSGNANKSALRAFLLKTSRLKSAIDRAAWVRLLAERSGVREDALIEELSTIKDEAQIAPRRETDSQSDSTDVRLKTRTDLVAEQLIMLAVANGSLEELRVHIGYFPPFYKEVVACLAGSGATKDTRAATYANALSLKAGTVLAEDPVSLLRSLKHEHLKEKRTSLLKDIQRAEKDQDEQALAKLLGEFDVLSKELHTG